MKRVLISTVALALALSSAPLLTGCDRTVSEDTTVKSNDDGSSSVKSKKVTENADGGVTVTEKKDVKNP